jgi:ABC-type multidrug transport system fused ATPase/permease subunit
VAQEPTLFDDTIGNNIRYGDLDNKKLTQEDVIRASTIASLHDFVKDMPQGYDTPAGML